MLDLMVLVFDLWVLCRSLTPTTIDSIQESFRSTHPPAIAYEARDTLDETYNTRNTYWIKSCRCIILDS